jgi:branched-chain amino acid transport system ATP-binding protein
MTTAVLRIEGLTKRYGALTVTDALDLEVQAGELHALIGPNGAGKTTLINQVAGRVRPDAGRIWLHDCDATRMPVHARARAGLGRSFQLTSLFDSFTALGNVAVAIQGTRSHSFRFWRPADTLPELVEPARAVLRQVGLAERADWPVTALSHGERRLLELALALAGRPSLLLLDEPMAGLGRQEAREVVEFLRGLKGGHAILLVEHDMDAVFALADRISVLASGRLIATGRPDEIRANREVRAAYLGEDLPR